LPGRDCNPGYFDRYALATLSQKKVITTLVITIIIESVVAAVFAVWRQKPLKKLLFSSLCANLFTQSLLWVAVNLFPRQYLITLIIVEVSIWGFEALIFYLLKFNRLDLREAFILSLAMNLCSFGIGWLLPV
jgi:hypothetical protein